MNAMKLNPSRLCMSLISVALCVQVSSCATPPSVRFHSLLTMDSGERITPSVSQRAGFAVNLTTVTIPAQVDQPQWLVRNTDGSLSLLEQERWVAPLRGELRAALLDRWSHAWGAHAVQVAAKDALKTPSSEAAKAASWLVNLDVTRWEAVPGREVKLESRWTLRAGPMVLSCHSVIREEASSESGAFALALAASHRRAVLRLADEMASRINASQRGEPLVCADAR